MPIDRRDRGSYSYRHERDNRDDKRRYRNARPHRPVKPKASKPKKPATFSPKLPTTPRQKKLMLKDAYKRLSKLLRMHGARLREYSISEIGRSSDRLRDGDARRAALQLVNKIDRIQRVVFDVEV